MFVATAQRKPIATQSTRMLVLANSFKQGARCVAGKRILSITERQQTGRTLGEWIRPVLTLAESDDAVPAQVFNAVPLSMLQLGLGETVGSREQVENRLWNQDQPVICSRLADREKLCQIDELIDSPATLWNDPQASRYDVVTPGYRGDLASSIYLIQPSQLHLYVQHNYQGALKLYAQFYYNGRLYKQLPVTDPAYSHWLRLTHPARAAVGERFELPNQDHYWLTVSLSKPFGMHRNRYKIVAALIDQRTG